MFYNISLNTSQKKKIPGMGGGQIFRPGRPWVPPSPLYNGYRVCLPGVKQPERGVDHPPHLALTLKKEYSYTSTPHSLF